MQSLKQRIYVILGSLLIAILAMGWIKTRVVPTVSDASRIVAMAAKADTTQTYVAEVRTTSVYHGKPVMSHSRVYHNPTSERIEYLSGPLNGCVTITHGGKTVLLRRGRPVTMTKSASSVSHSNRLALLLKNYRAVRAADSRDPAGRDCYVVVLVPRRGGEHARKLWIDKSTHVVLLNYDRHRKQRLSSSALTSVDFPEAIPGRLFAVPSTRGIRLTSEPMDRGKLSKQLGFAVSLPEHMADGYVFYSSCLYRCACNCGHQSAHLIYTDGMRTISVFQSAALAHCGGKKCDLKSGMGAGDCAANDSKQDGVAVVRARDKMVVVVGDLGGSELMRIARSIP